MADPVRQLIKLTTTLEVLHSKIDQLVTDMAEVKALLYANASAPTAKAKTAANATPKAQVPTGPEVASAE